MLVQLLKKQFWKTVYLLKKITYSSEEEFIDDVMSNMKFMAGVIAAVSFLIIFILGMPCCSIAADISKKRKFKNMQN